MKIPRLISGCVILVLAGAGAMCAAKQDAPASNAKAQTQQQRPDAATRITIEVTGGEKDLPVENASVYLKYIEERKIKKDKTVELNVKTNHEGTAHVPDAPLGRVLIQVIAEGWKTYGRWYDITDAKQTIKVHLERPPKWY
jgi:hypothetical protein